jgi:hypothetical protein
VSKHPSLGKLDHEGLGARGIAAASTTDCQRSQTFAAAGVSAVQVAEKVFGRVVPNRESPFAMATGMNFEHGITKHEAAKLVLLYQGSGRFATKVKVLDLTNDTKDHDLQLQLAAEAEAIILDRMYHGGGPDVIIQFPIVMRPNQALLRPDFLVAVGERGWRVGEVKSYLDRDGLTDGYKVGSAVRQAAAGIVALLFLVREHQLPEDLVDTKADLVLLRHGQEGASLRTLGAEAEILSIQETLERSAELLSEASALAGGASLDSEEAVQAIPHAYGPGCHGTCAMAEVCRGEAMANGQLLFDGAGVAALGLAGISGARAAALAAGAKAENAQEEHMAKHMRRGWAASK